MAGYANGTWGRFYEALEESNVKAEEARIRREKEVKKGKEESLIKTFFTVDQIKKLYLIAMAPDVEDNNRRAELVREVLDPEFLEIGTGTNRITVMRNQMIYKIALDNRGMIDNLTEFTRSEEKPEVLARAYETNMLILVSEYVTVMDLEEFNRNREGICEILRELHADGYIFDDLGFTKKNHMNWGYRENGDIVALDYGYLWPVFDMKNSLKCPRCGEMLRYSSTYTTFVCTNPSCKGQYRIMDIRRRCPQDMEDAERKSYEDIMDYGLPNLSGLTKKLAKARK